MINNQHKRSADCCGDCQLLGMARGGSVKVIKGALFTSATNVMSLVRFHSFVIVKVSGCNIVSIIIRLIFSTNVEGELRKKSLSVAKSTEFLPSTLDFRQLDPLVVMLPSQMTCHPVPTTPKRFPPLNLRFKPREDACQH